jgi:hypothetical protein
VLERKLAAKKPFVVVRERQDADVSLVVRLALVRSECALSGVVYDLRTETANDAVLIPVACEARDILAKIPVLADMLAARRKGEGS